MDDLYEYTRAWGNPLPFCQKRMERALMCKQLSQPEPSSSSDSQLTAQQEIAAALGQQMGQVGMEMIRRNMNIQPTLSIRPSYRFNVMFNKDVVLEPY